MMNPKYYQQGFQAEALKWWKTLSINEQKSFEKKHFPDYPYFTRQKVSEIYDKEILQKGLTVGR